MELFLLFGNMIYYPEGGLLDYDTHYPTLEDAQSAALLHLQADEFTNPWWEWANIARVTQDGIVERWEWQGDHWGIMR